MPRDFKEHIVRYVVEVVIRCQDDEMLPRLKSDAHKMLAGSLRFAGAHYQHGGYRVESTTAEPLAEEPS